MNIILRVCDIEDFGVQPICKYGIEVVAKVTVDATLRSRSLNNLIRG